MELPQLPVPIHDYIKKVSTCSTQADVLKLTEPYIQYEGKLRHIYAQQPDHPAATENHLVPIFQADNPSIAVRARDLTKESAKLRDQYLLALSEDQRKLDGAPATVKDLNHFRSNFNIFSENSLSDLDWNNVIAAGSAVVTALLPVPAEEAGSKRALRTYYHETLAPASDVDLFLYGLNEEQAIEKVKQIESKVRDSILSETTTIRTKNAITIVSEYPTRHVQIVLRLYKSVSEILTGFDVDCSSVAFDGSQVWASPRALSAFITQINTIDLTRRSPSYENRLSKYSHRGFEAFWPFLNRDRVDPTILERSFKFVQGLARILVLEKLPHPDDRDAYLARRRAERGRPPLTWNDRYRHQLPGNVKESQPDDVAEWVEEESVSSYHTFSIPYGPKYNARKIERLLFTKDLLLNAEWNRPKDRNTNLHRHPAFFGQVDDIIQDCCGFCPEPTTDEDFAALEEEAKHHVSGKLTFLKDDPGRQSIGSFHPLTDDDWTEMAYVGNTARLCSAIIEKDIDAVLDWFENGELEQVDVNRRDHTGRTPLQLATMSSTPEIVQLLIDRGARIVSRLYNGLTALHIAAYRGQAEMVKALLDRSAVNEEQEARKDEVRKEARRDAVQSSPPVKDDGSDNTDESDLVDDEYDNEEADDDITESFVKVAPEDADNVAEDNEDDPDVYDVDVLAWDHPLSALHFAIIGGHINVIELLVEEYAADVLLPVKILSSHDRSPQNAILSLVLALQLPFTEARSVIESMISLGATPTQADMKQVSVLHSAVNEAREGVLDQLKRLSDPETVKKNINVLLAQHSGYGWYDKSVDSPLLTAIRTRRSEIVKSVLEMGALPEISVDSYAVVYHREENHPSEDTEEIKKIYLQNVEQPVVLAAKMEMPEIALQLIELGADPNTCPKAAYSYLAGYTWRQESKSLLDIVRENIISLRESVEKTATETPQLPPKLDPDHQYLTQDRGSYQAWFAAHDLAQAKYVKDYEMRQYEDDIKVLQKGPVEGEREKKEALRTLVDQYVQLEGTLVKKGAKSFHDILPDAPKGEDRRLGQTIRAQPKDKQAPYAVEFSFFHHPHVTDSVRNSYISLYEAAWRGDGEAVKELCLGKVSPLQVAVQDSAGFSPMSIAIVRGHLELASTILEIAAAQYQPKKGEKYQYRLKGADDSDECDDEDSDSDNSEELVLKQIIHEEFTIEDVTKLADDVKSRVSPLTMLNWQAEFWRAQKGQPQEKPCSLRPSSYSVYNHKQGTWPYFHDALNSTRNACKISLFHHAITTNNLPQLRFMLRAGRELMERKAEKDDSKIFQLGAHDFEHAIRLGRTEGIGEIISKTGAGIPLQKMVQASGAVVNEKPRYYQGLTVNGAKRTDWAERDAPRSEKAVENEHSPVLRAVMIGNLKSVEYFLSDAPLHRYKDFAQHFNDDARVQSLIQTEGGLDKALTTWLGTRSELALHMAVIAPSKPKPSTALMDYILRVMPGTIEVKSKEGKTALQLAFELGKLSMAKALIKAGANQATRNSIGENVLHTVLTNSQLSNPIFLPQVLEMLESSLIQSLLLERCSQPTPGFLTPLALYLQVRSDIDVVEMILAHSQGKDLEILNGAGDFILHSVVRKQDEALIMFLVQYRPEMLYWENATGMTPLDVAETQYLRSIVKDPPRLRHENTHNTANESFDLFVKKAKTKTQKQIDEVLALDENDDARYSPEFIIDRLLKNLASKHPGKRRLVSVIEANEVARRLATEQQKQSAENKRRDGPAWKFAQQSAYDRYGRDKDNEQNDEVELWKNETSDPQYDLACWEIKIRRERDGERGVNEEAILKKYHVPTRTSGKEEGEDDEKDGDAV